jgi:hypothetical protein
VRFDPPDAEIIVDFLGVIEIVTLVIKV